MTGNTYISGSAHIGATIIEMMVHHIKYKLVKIKNYL